MVGKVVVIGLGMFGRNLVRHLARRGGSVLAIDRDEALVQEVAEEVDAAVCADATDEQALAELQLERMTCAVVAIGTDSTESSILATALLRQIGVPRIIARGVSELHGRVLYAVGAHEVVNPEEAMGERLARRLVQPNVLEHLDLGGGVELAEVEAPEGWVGKSLVELDVRREHGLSVVGVRRGGEVVAALDGDEEIESGDVLLAIGPPDSVAKVAALA